MFPAIKLDTRTSSSLFARLRAFFFIRALPEPPTLLGPAIEDMLGMFSNERSFALMLRAFTLKVDVGIS